MTLCSACRTPTGSQLEMCNGCLDRLPSITADLYRRGHCTTRQVMDCLRMRMTSVKKLHGGRHGRERRP